MSKKKKKKGKRKRSQSELAFMRDPVFPQRFTPLIGGLFNFTVMAHEAVRFAHADFVDNGPHCFDVTLKCTGNRSTIIGAIEWAYANREAIAEVGVLPTAVMMDRRDKREPISQGKRKLARRKKR